jgi:hypothetical protein
VHGALYCLWIVANLGPCAKVAEVLSQWLGTVDFDELEAKRYERANPG